MSVLAELLDHLHHVWVCKRTAGRLAQRLATGAVDRGPRDLRPGARLQVRGRVEPAEALVAPLSGKLVVGYRVVIEVPAHYWMNRRVVVDFGQVGAFSLTGGHVVGLPKTLAVGPGPAQLVAARPCLEGVRGAGSHEAPREFPPAVASVLADRAQLRAEGGDARRYAWAEYHLHAGDDVLADGVVGPDGVSLRGSGPWPLLLTTRPKADLLADLADPDEALLRLLPARALSDRSGEDA